MRPPMEPLLTPKEATLFLKISVWTIYRYVDEGKLPRRKVGNGLRFTREEVERLADVKEKYKDKIKARYPKEDLQKELTNKPPVSMDKAGGEKVARSKRSRRRFPYGSIYQRRVGGNWTIDFRTPTGERVQKVVKAMTWQDAHERLKETIYEDYYEKSEEEEKKSITFTARAQEHIQTFSVTKRSCRTDEYRLRRLVEFFKEIELRKITPSMIRKYVALRLREGKSESTVNREIALLKTIFNVAIEDGYLEENPAKKIKKFSELDTERDRVLNEEEEEELFSKLADHVRPVVLTALHTGLRLNEVLGLRWSDVNMDKRFIKVERTKSKRTRFIPINSVLYGELERLKECRNDNHRVFPFKSIRTAFVNALDRAGIEDFTFHDLRRTFGTRMLEKGVDIVTISKLYGHSSVLVTQRYLHPKDKLSIEAVELLAEKPQKPDHSGDNLVTSEEQSNVIH